MDWKIRVTAQYRHWFRSLSDSEADDVMQVVHMLRERGPLLGFPYSSKVMLSRHSQMRELRIQHAGDPYRVLYAFDPQRAAVLLLGGEKTGDDRWYERNVPVADRLFDEYLRRLQEERS